MARRKMLGLDMIKASTLSEGDFLLVSAPSASSEEAAGLQSELDAHFASSKGKAVVVKHPVSVHHVQPPEDGLLWVSAVNSTAEELDAIRAEIETRLGVEPGGEGAETILIANFAPDLNEMTYEEVELLRARLDAWLELAREYRPAIK